MVFDNCEREYFGKWDDGHFGNLEGEYFDDRLVHKRPGMEFVKVESDLGTMRIS